MDPRIKANWLAALRSGKYRQGKEMLFDPEERSYCCLGVLRSVHRMRKHAEGDEYIAVKAAERIGLSFGVQDMLAGFNDSGRTFAEIADWIEANL